MEQWKLVTVLVTVFAFSLEIRPMDSFLTSYLTSPEVNVSLKEVSDVLTPIRLYAAVVGTFFVFLLTDYLRYKPVMIFNGLIGILAYICLLNSPSTFRIKIFEVGLSLFVCSEVAYLSYTYAKIEDIKHFQTATGYIKAGMLSGKFVSGLLGQLVVYINNGNYYTLSYYSLASVAFASMWACFLPNVKNSTYSSIVYTVTNKPKGDTSKAAIYDQHIPNYTAEKNYPQNVSRTSLMNRFNIVYDNFKHSYTNYAILRWSFWHVIGTATYIQVFLYANILYTYIADVTDNKQTLLNGVVDSLATLSAAFCSYKIGKVNVDWARHGNKFLIFSSLALGLALCACFYLKNLFYVYIIYIFYCALVQSVFVIATSEIAKELKDDCYSLVLGFNSCLSTLISTCSSMLLVGMNVSVPVEFLMYGSTYMVLGVLYACASLFEKDMLTRRFKQLP